MADSRVITKDRLIDPEAIPSIIADLKAMYDQTMINLEGFKQVAAAMQKNIPTGIPQTTDELKQHQKALKQSQVLMNGFTETQKKALQEKIAYQKALKDEKDSILASNSAYKAWSVENEKMRQAAKDLAIQLQTLNDELNNAKTAAMSAAKAHGTSSEEYKKAAENVKKLTDEQKKASTAAQGAVKNFNTHDAALRKADESMGNYTRSVGNYSKATVGLKTKIQELARGMGGLSGIIGEVMLMFGAEGETLERVRRLSNELVRTSREMSYEKNIDKLAEQEGIKVKEEAIAVGEEQVVTNEAVADSNIEAGATAAEASAGFDLLATAEAIALAPITLLILGVAALVGVFALLLGSHHKEMEAVKERSKAMDGSIIIDKQQRDAWNENIVKMGELNDAYSVLMGTMDKYQAKNHSLALNFKKDIADLQDTETAALQDLDPSTLKGFFTGLWDAAKDAITGKQLGSHIAQSITNVVTQYGQQMNDKKQQLDAETRNNDKEKEDAMRKSADERLKSNIEYAQRIVDSQNELVKQTETRERAQVEIERKYATEKLDVDIKYYTDKKKAGGLDFEDNDKYQTLLSERGEIQKVAANKQLKITIDELIKEREAQLQANKETADLTQNKYAQQAADYELAKNNLINDLKERYGEEYALQAQSKLELQNLAKDNAQKIRDIERAAADAQDDAQQKVFANIRNSLDRQLAETTQKYETFKRKQFQFLQDNGNGTYAGLSADNKKLYDTNQAAGEGENANSLLDIDNKRKETAAADTQKASELKVQGETEAGTGIPMFGVVTQKAKQLNSDQLSAEDDRYKSEKQKAIDNANTTQAELDNIETEHANKRFEIQKKFNDMERELAYKQIEDELNAAQQISDGKIEKDQQTIAAQMEMYKSQQEVQATLAGEGRANSLSAIQASEARATAQAQADARKKQQIDEATQMVEAFMNSYNSLLKAGDTPQKALTQALASVGAAKAIASGLSGVFYEGTADTGNGGALDSKGGFLSMLHPNEAVINRKRNQEAPGLAKAWLNEGNQGIMQYVMSSMFNKEDFIFRSDSSELSVISAKLDKLDDVNASIKNQPFVEHIYENESMAVRKVRENGNEKTIVTHKFVSNSKPHAGI